MITCVLVVVSVMHEKQPAISKLSSNSIQNLKVKKVALNIPHIDRYILLNSNMV